MGPHPFPMMVRDFQAVISAEAREQFLEKEGKLPDAVLACVGGGSNAMGAFYNFIDDKDVKLIGCEAGGKGVELESKVSSSQITSLRCQFTPEYTRAANGSATRALTTGVEFVHIKDVAGSFVADDVVDKDPDDGDEPGGGGGEAPDPAA